MKKLNFFLNVVMGSFFGFFVGNTIMNYRNYKQFPDLYAASSVPWYCYGALPSFLLFLAVVITCVVIMKIVQKRRNRKLK